jgi:ABC-2 type transport system permease protein
MKAMLAMCAKDLRLLVRDRMGFFFAVFFPLLMAIFFGTVFAGGDGGKGDDAKKIGVLVVDSDKTAASEKFVKQLTDAAEFRVTVEQSLDEATTKIRKGQGGVAAVHITKGYGEASERMFWGDPPVLEVYTDPSRKAEIGMFQGLLTKYAFMRMQEMFSNPTKFIPSTQDALAELKGNQEMDPQTKSALETFLPNLEQFLVKMPSTTTGADGSSTGGLGNWEPVKIESKQIMAEKRARPPNGYSITFPQGIMWGVIGCSLAIGLSLVIERSHGTFVRLRMAPLPRWGVLGGKAMTCMVLIMGMAMMLMLIGLLPMFSVRPASPLMLIFGIFSTAVCFTGLMMIVAALGKTESSAAGLGWGMMMIFSMVGGGMIPLFFMPGWLQGLGSFSPVKWGILAIEGGIWRGFSFVEMLKPCGILLTVGAVSFAVGVGVLRRTERG